MWDTQPNASNTLPLIWVKFGRSIHIFKQQEAVVNLLTLCNAQINFLYNELCIVTYQIILTCGVMASPQVKTHGNIHSAFNLHCEFASLSYTIHFLPSQERQLLHQEMCEFSLNKCACGFSYFAGQAIKFSSVGMRSLQEDRATADI
jgi:hypothetical protein